MNMKTTLESLPLPSTSYQAGEKPLARARRRLEGLRD